MIAPTTLRFAPAFALPVGGTDFVTGIGRLIAPAFALARRGATLVGGDAIAFVLFVGVPTWRLMKGMGRDA